MRDPSIHIKESDLKKVLVELDLDYRKINYKDLVNSISSMSRRYSCDNRVMVATNKKDEKTVTNITSTDHSTASLVSSVLYNIRISMKHKGVTRIKPTDRDWPRIKELAIKCTNFSEAFELDIKTGTVEYIKRALQSVRSMRNLLYTCISMYDEICSQYQSSQELLSVSGSSVEEFHNLYMAKVLDQTGMSVNYKNSASEMLNFAKAVNLADQANCDIDIFLDAQFDGFSWCNSIPTPAQLCNDKAMERLMKYMAKHNIQISDRPSKAKESFWNNLKSLGDEE